LSRFYDSFKERAGSDPRVMRKMFIAERDRQYSVTQDVRKCEASYEYMVSGNAACAGRFLCDEYHLKPHDNSNISRCEAEANKLKKKVETIKDTRYRKATNRITCHHSIGAKTNVSKSRRKKEDKRKARKRSSLAVKE